MKRFRNLMKPHFRQLKIQDHIVSVGTCTPIGSFQISACRPTTSFPTSDLREREHFCLISFEKCGESGYFIHQEVQDEVVNVLFPSNFRRRQSTASGSAASWLTVTVEVSRDMRVCI